MSKTAKYQDQSVDKLTEQLSERRAELAELIRSQRVDPEENVHAKRNLRRDIARIKTAINQKQGDA